MEVIRNQEFLLLPATEIAKLLASDDMNIPNEETILNALLTWVRHDLEQRKKDLSKLLANIRLPLLAPQVECCNLFILFPPYGIKNLKLYDDMTWLCLTYQTCYGC